MDKLNSALKEMRYFDEKADERINRLIAKCYRYSRLSTAALGPPLPHLADANTLASSSETDNGPSVGGGDGDGDNDGGQARQHQMNATKALIKNLTSGVPKQQQQQHSKLPSSYVV